MHSQKHFILHLKLSIQNYKFSKNKSSSSFPFQLPSRYTSKIQIKSQRQQIGKTEHYIYCNFSELIMKKFLYQHIRFSIFWGSILLLYLTPTITNETKSIANTYINIDKVIFADENQS